MKYLILVIMILTFSCVTEKRCLDKFPPDTITEYSVLFGGDPVYTDTIIIRELIGDTVFVSSPWMDDLFVDNDSMVITSIQAHVSLAYSRAWIENNKLHMILIQKDSIFRFKLDSAIRSQRDTLRIQSTEIVNKTVIPNWAITYRAIALLLIAMIIVFAILALIFIKIK